jgi:hypothetical protein
MRLENRIGGLLCGGGGGGGGGGTNDIEKNNVKEGLKHILKFV